MANAIEVKFPDIGDFKNIPEAGRCDKRRLGAVPLDQGVDNKSCAVVEKASFLRLYPRLRKAIHDSLDEISVRRRALGVDDASALVVVGNQISERAADIDSDSKTHKSSRALSLRQASPHLTGPGPNSKPSDTIEDESTDAIARDRLYFLH